jgi:hypothetical protein
MIKLNKTVQLFGTIAIRNDGIFKLPGKQSEKECNGL